MSNNKKFNENRKYSYLHITVNPKNCDASSRETDFLTDGLINELDKYLISLSYNYSRAIELNKDKIGHHYHFAMFSKYKRLPSYIKDMLTEIVSHHYLLSEDSKKHLIQVKHKTKKQIALCACGYLTKQFKGTEFLKLCRDEIEQKLNGEPSKFISNIDDDDMKQYREEYETLNEHSAQNKFSVWVLDENKTLQSIKEINKYYEVLVILMEKDEEIDKIISSSKFHKLYPYILHKYKISYRYKQIKEFHRYIVEFLISINKYSKEDYESLVQLVKFQKEEWGIDIGTTNQYETNTILNYWSLQ